MGDGDEAEHRWRMENGEWRMEMDGWMVSRMSMKLSMDERIESMDR